MLNFISITVGNTYDSYVKKGLRSPDYKNMMVKKMNQPGVFEHGRIGHRKAVEEVR